MCALRLYYSPLRFNEIPHAQNMCYSSFINNWFSVHQPMLEHVRIHPELVTGTKDYEVDPIR